MSGNDCHQRGLGDDPGQSAAKTEQDLEDNCGHQKSDERHGHMAERQHSHRYAIQSEAQTLWQLAGKHAAKSRSKPPASLQITQSSRTGMKEIPGERHDQHVGTNNSSHENRM